MAIKQNRINFYLLILLLAFTLQSNCNIWDNVFSQTQASHPISLSQSFNFDFQLPEQFGLDGQFDFNSQLKLLTLTLSKNILIQRLDIIKAQLDLNSLILNVNQFLLGCERFKMGISDEVSQKVQNRVGSANLSKKSLFLVNLLFKYIGQNETSEGGILGNIDSKQKGSKQTKQPSLLDSIKNSGIFNQIVQSGILGDMKNKGILSKKVVYNMFEFSINLYQDPKKIIDSIQKGKQTAQKILDNDQLQDFDISDFDFDQMKFVLLTDTRTGQIKKAYKNRQMKQELQFRLTSTQKKAIECKGQVKTLTMQDLTNGAKFLYENKDDLEGAFAK